LGCALTACSHTGVEETSMNVAPVHEHKPPHGGALVELGDEAAHVEFLLDPKLGELTAFVLDDEAEEAVRIPQEKLVIRLRTGAAESTSSVSTEGTRLELSAVANVLTGETIADTSEFIGQSNALKGLAGFEAVLGSIRVKGSTFDGVAFRYPEGNEK
jgi:hypothetical protein